MPDDVNGPACRRLHRAARHRAYRGDEGDHRAPDRARRRLCRRGACAVQRRRDGAPRRRAALRRASRSAPLDEMLAGARVDVAPYKRDPMDFVLWKPSGPQEPGWPSPGRHRDAGPPGLAHRVLGHVVEALDAGFGGGSPATIPRREVFDIHGGGIDLVFPHHENEIAQTCCAFGIAAHGQCLDAQRLPAGRRREDVEVARQLRHHPRAAGQDLAAGRGVCASTMLRTHYRQPIDWTVRGLRGEREDSRPLVRASPAPAPNRGSDWRARRAADDLNTPEGDRRAARARRRGRAQGARRELCAALGFLVESDAGPGRRGGARRSRSTPAEVEALIAARRAARAAKDFAESDRIRDELAALGVVVKDNKDGTTTLGGRALMAVQAAAARACGPICRADAPGARGDLPGEHRGIDGRRLQRGAAGRLGRGGRRRAGLRRAARRTT